ncbi:class II aldolase/adducin domain-containing protein [Sistotremastrum suecicum HHB10207 ss-3]|uniref:Class II aldolase/adducin domain-containing protein n=1 Tax=Sistotremastrum suecicum HHB10207 ss-3 TaxID=1314776 RepID=A0A165ZPM5_9AGAM|nr:class II aldolase/adducin domain-containing protein [Sistotremastrum suecicum HHB10207 ss-3]
MVGVETVPPEGFISATGEENKSIKSTWPKKPVFESKLEEREWVKFRLAQAFRIFGHHKFDAAIAGHITARDPIKTDCFWVNPFGIHFSLVTPDLLLLVDHGCNILDESGPIRLLNSAAFMIHSGLHMSRADILCAAHSHTLFGRAYSALGRELDMLTQDHCIFYNDHILYTNYQGVVLDEQEGLAIAAQLGPKKAALLQNHGLLVVSDSIESAVVNFIAFERSCEVSLLSLAAAGGDQEKLIKIGEKEADAVWRTIGTQNAGWFAGLCEFKYVPSRSIAD